jgi:hypothetical protein
MIDELTLENRLAALEGAVAEMQQKLQSGNGARNWIDAVCGSIRDDEAFTEALAYGRAVRDADRPDNQESEVP